MKAEKNEMMNYHWNYGDRVLNLPASALDAGADAVQLQILFLLARDPEADTQTLAKNAGCSTRVVKDALSFWCRAGILEPCDGSEKEIAVPKAVQKGVGSEKKLARADEIPTYSVPELNDMMERRQSLRTMLEEAQRILGKMLNQYEINILFGMVDYLNLDEDYILLLLAHCVRIEKKGMRTIERYAISLIDRGITTSAALEEQVQIIEAQYTLEGKVRSIFGMKSRSLTEKEQKMIADWIGFGYGEDIIRRAYEITVDTINEPSMRYTHAILDRWHAEGLKTMEEIERRIEQERAEKNAKKDSGGNSDFKTFDPNAAFEAALKRSFKKTDSKTNGKD